MSSTFRRLLWLCLAFLTSSQFAAAAEQPNIVVLLGDDQGWRDFGFMGNTTIRTPHLDRLASQGTVFTQACVPHSLCRPSLATILTGLYPHQHKISGNDPPKGTDRAEMLRHVRRLPMVPRLLGEQGYVSFQSGKWWEGAPALAGFTKAMSHGDPARGGRHGDVGLVIGRQGLKPVTDFLDEVARPAPGQSKAAPFFLWYAPMLPHQPHNPPARLLAKYQAPGKSEHVAKYEAMCEWFDETIGELLGELDRRKLTDNTLVIFLTDNGWIQDPVAAKFAPRSKRSPYDGGLRTPMILRWPGKVPVRRNESLVSSVDVAPTFYAAAGVKTPAECTGEDLVEVARTGKRHHEMQFGETYAHDVADIDNPAASLEYRWCRTPEWKLILPQNPDMPVELFEIAKDSGEEHNVADKHPEVVARLKGQINAWWSP